MAEALTSPAELERRTLSKVIRRLIPFVFICYVVAYIDRVHINFVNSILQSHLKLDAPTYGRRALLPGVFHLRDPQQPDPGAGGRADLDRPHHDRLGHHLDDLRLRGGEVELLRDARPARPGRGGVLSRHGALPDLLDSRPGA